MRAGREQLLHLLAEAAELEHNLLCSYLYAAFSLKRSESEGLTADELAAVDQWRELILRVAHEEMTHLVLVQNLLIAVGARAHWNRPNFPVAPGYHPAGIVVALAPFDMETLDHFIFLERPEGMPLPDATSFSAERDYERGSGPESLMPAACDYSTIGEFYGAIRRCLLELTRAMGENALFAANPEMQIGLDIVSLKGVNVVVGLDSALGALDTIVVQGEGAPAEAEDSHFDRFCRIKREYEALEKARPGFAPARPVARNPVMRAPIEEDRIYVNAPEAAAVLDLSNALYNHMIRLLAQAWGRSIPDRDDKVQLVDAAIGVMSVLAAVCGHLTTLQASNTQPGINAGVSFATLRATEALLEGPGEWKILGERLVSLADGVRRACIQQCGLALASQLDDLAQKFIARSVG